MANDLLLNKDTINRERMDSMTRTFGKVGRVLCNRADLTCKVLPTGPAPGWNDGRVVYFNEAMIGSVTKIENIISMTGLFYHELCHVIFTPRMGSDFRKQVIQKGLHQSFNALEDQRIETLMFGKYPSTAPYFVNMFMKFCLANDEQWESNHILAHGRKYLPAEVRQEFADRFKWQHLRKDFEKVIDQYRLLVFPRDMEKGLKLIQKYNDLLEKINPPSMPHGHDSRDDNIEKEGRPATQAEQQEASEWAEWYESADDEDEGSSPASGDDQDESEDDSDGEDGEGDTDGTEDSDEESSGSGKEEADEDSEENEGSGSGKSDDPSNDESNDDSEQWDEGDSYGAGVGAGSALTGNNELRELLEEVESELMENKEVLSEARSKQRVILDGDGKTAQKLDTKHFNYTTPKDAMRQASVKFGRELEQLRADMDPGWHTHKASGRINVQRAMQGVDLDTVFDQWDEGSNDRTDIEAVLYVDCSDSMNGYGYGSTKGLPMQQACEALWTTKRALEKIDASVTVYAFNSDSYIMYGNEDKAETDKVRQIKASGGTEPTGAIEDSLRIFRNTTRKTKIALFITDGEWSYSFFVGKDDGNEKWREYIRRMNMAGIVTGLAFINGGGGTGSIPEESRNECQMGEYINNPMDLVPLARRIVKTVMKG